MPPPSDGTRHLAPAKVNLTLHVTGRRADGRHDLDSLVAFADLGDVLHVSPGDALTIDGPFANGVPVDDRNLIRRALAAAGTTRAVDLDKRLPHPAGLGGGSSDAAAALRAVGADLGLDALMALGADLPVCLAAAPSRMRGAGERVDPVALPRLHAVLVNPGVAVPTGAVFAALEGHGPPMPDVLPAGDPLDWLGGMRNDLQAPATGVASVIADVLAALTAAGARLSRMSGSGATCFGLFPDPAAAEAAARRLDYPGWWARACTLNPSAP
ncbi:4-(cytidine 5'-diphospho)-2-C-methyl-D-erythritol kinase [Jannaschia sp. LMIT008]|uniref:4-(cytidine 5'-diphospho)-2-C-methyl-D-erythritol kinase n=1 Tax=Jannaschia maritima TaxID=3032585 RepID=UPI0028110749|nr:4-(cytidine 5'-diphospho)-2-C-methyl-D-erythritol kinase [Jannaschia sp. LMIT008]